jgi:hypothetical protein
MLMRIELEDGRTGKTMETVKRWIEGRDEPVKL